MVIYRIMRYINNMEIFDLILYNNRVGMIITCDQVSTISSLGFRVEDYFILEVPKVGIIEIRCLETINKYYDITHLSRVSYRVQGRLDYYMSYRRLFPIRMKYSTMLVDNIKTIRFRTYSTLKGLRDIYLDGDLHLMDLKGKIENIEVDDYIE